MGSAGSTARYESIMNQVDDYDGNTKTFIHIMNQVNNLKCESELGKPFQVWKLSCLYNNTASRNNDLGPASAKIISDFMETQAEINTMPNGKEKDLLVKYMRLGNPED